MEPMGFLTGKPPGEKLPGRRSIWSLPTLTANLKKLPRSWTNGQTGRCEDGIWGRDLGGIHGTKVIGKNLWKRIWRLCYSWTRRNILTKNRSFGTCWPGIYAFSDPLFLGMVSEVYVTLSLKGWVLWPPTFGDKKGHALNHRLVMTGI